MGWHVGWALPTTEHDGELVGDAHPTEPRSGERHAEDLSPSREVGGSERSDGEGLAREALSEPAARLYHGESNEHGDGPAAGALPLAGKEDDAGTSLRSVRPTDGGESPRHEQILAQLREVRTRAETAIEWERGMRGAPILDFALHQLTLGRTWLLEAECFNTWFVHSLSHLEPSNAASEISAALTNATNHLNDSVSLMRQSGTQHHIPRGLLQRAGLRRAMLEVGFELQDASRHFDRETLQRESAASALPLTDDTEELLDKANKDLTEAETIAERGSMLIWQIEAALERARLYLTLASANSAPLRLNPGKEDQNAETQRTQRDWLEMARQKLEETAALVKKTERTYEPHEPMDEIWKDTKESWDPPSYIGAIKPGTIVGYHCRNEEIDWLEQAITLRESAARGDAETQSR